MLMGLKQQLKAGDTVPITLKIEQNGKVTEQTVQAQVRDMTASGQMGGGHMDHKH
jgi:copper(I)-binding protein